MLVPQSRSQMPRSFWSATGIATSGLILWPVPTPEVRDSRTSRHSAHAHSHVWQISLVLVPIYCVYKSIQDRNVDPDFSSAWQKGPLGRGWLFLCSLVLSLSSAPVCLLLSIKSLYWWINPPSSFPAEYDPSLLTCYQSLCESSSFISPSLPFANILDKALIELGKKLNQARQKFNHAQ